MILPASVIVIAKLVILITNYVNFYQLKKQRVMFGDILVFLPRTIGFTEKEKKRNEVFYINCVQRK